MVKDFDPVVGGGFCRSRTFRDIVGKVGRVGQRREAEDAANMVQGDWGDDELTGRLDPGS